MSYLNIKNVKVSGIAACVPSRVENNRDYTLLSQEELENYINTTGIERRHCAIHDGSICTSDLCQKASEKLIEDLGWDKSEIGLIIFASQTCDYRLPSTACVLQNKLGITNDCVAFDMTLGCPGYMVGLGTACSMMQNGTIKKALLMCGNTQSEYACYQDKSMYLLLGDAGTVTALEYNPENADKMDFKYLTDGSKYDCLIVPDGASRNPVNAHSFELEEYDYGVKRTRLHEKMDGEEVFSFAIRNVPKQFRELCEHEGINMLEDLDYMLFHQANKFMCEKVRKKLGFPLEKFPYNIQEFGNTSGATLPLLMVTNLQEELCNSRLSIGLAAVGVGFALCTGRITTNKIVVPSLMYL